MMSTSLVKISILVVSILFCSVMFAVEKEKKEPKKEKVEIIYEYVDPNNNRYIIENKKENALIHYIPVQARQSSSGVYDGGKPFKKVISIKTYLELKTVLDKGFKSKEDHEKQRKMGTAIIRITKSGKTDFVLLAFDSKSRKDIDQFLNDVLSKKESNSKKSEKK